MPSEEVAVFTPEVADALTSLVTSNPPRPSNSSFFDTTNCLLAFTAAGATARFGSTLGTGTAVLWNIKADNTIEATGVSAVDYVNLATSSVGTNKYILLLRVSGKLVCVWEEC